MKLSSILFTLLLLSIPSLSGQARDAQRQISSVDLVELIRASETQYQAKTSKATMTMHVVKENWDRKLKIESMGEGRDKFLARIIEPVKERGTVTLKVGDHMWNYLPKVDRILKIPSSLMGDSWMGSHFTNDDLVKGDKVDQLYDFTLIKETPEIYQIKATPREDSAVVWGSLEYSIQKSPRVPLEVKYYDEDQELVRRLVFEDVQEVSGRFIPLKLLVYPVDEPSEKTEIIYEKLEFDSELPGKVFSVRNLKKRR